MRALPAAINIGPQYNTLQNTTIPKQNWLLYRENSIRNCRKIICIISTFYNVYIPELFLQICYKLLCDSYYEKVPSAMPFHGSFIYPVFYYTRSMIPASQPCPPDI